MDKNNLSSIQTFYFLEKLVQKNAISWINSNYVRVESTIFNLLHELDQENKNKKINENDIDFMKKSIEHVLAATYHLNQDTINKIKEAIFTITQPSTLETIIDISKIPIQTIPSAGGAINTVQKQKMAKKIKKLLQ